MEVKTYILQPEKKFLKQGYFAEDEEHNIVYEFKMLTQPIIGNMDFLFINHVTGTETEHKVSHTVTTETSGFFPIANVKSSFKLDGIKIWDYLHDQDIRLDTDFSGDRLGAVYTVSLRGEPIGKVSTYSPEGAGIITTNHYLKVETTEEYLDPVFLVAFAVARTEQLFLE